MFDSERSLANRCDARQGMPSNMRMQLTRPRGRRSKAGRLSNASLQLIRGR